MAVLLLERGHHGHQRFDEPGAVRAVRPKAALAPEHPGTNGPLRRVIRRFHSWMSHERPQRLAPLEDLATHALGLGHTTRLPRFEPPLHFLPDRPHIAGKTGMRQRALTHPMPPMEHLAGLRSQGLPDDLRLATPHDHGLNIPQQMRPTQLPPPRGIPAIPTPAIGDQPPPEALS